MPYISDTPSLPAMSPNLPEALAQRLVDDDVYAARALPGCSERPLSEQLEPIAVVGMGCRLPGAVKSPSDFWDLMMNQRTGQMPKVPASRFNIDAHLHPDNHRPGSFSVPGGYFLDDMDVLQEFDPSFFGITPIEAMWMDPQQRKLLEVVYESFESAGVTLQSISGSQTAVFVASFTSDYQQMAFKEPSFRHSFAATGVDTGILSNRISHVFNLKGPSVYVNTACSSSVYALHNACNALRNQECVAAVVGGVNLIITVDQHMNTAKLGVLSPTSTCHTFDASADGYGRAEGVGAMYLKRLSDAIKDGDPIRAVIRSSATNSNGKVPAVGITHPNRDGQVDVIRHAYRRGGNLDPRLTGYVECHGTGTPVGDPLEVHAVSLAMNQGRGPNEEPLMIGAVKTSIGHSEAASGLSALIKAVLMVERGIIPPTRGIVTLNPAIKWKDWQVRPVTEAVYFPPHISVRRVGFNSFGYGGTNAHAIVEDADSLLVNRQSYKFHLPGSKLNIPHDGALEQNRPFLLSFSAHERSALRRNMVALGAVTANYDLADIAYTLGNHRSAFGTRSYVVASRGEGVTKLTAGEIDTVPIAENRAVGGLCFVFTGQGAQWARMGVELMDYYPSFRSTIRALDDVLHQLGDDEVPGWTLEGILLEPQETSLINAAEFAQPLTTAVQVALVQLLRSWGVSPSVVVGHSSGEIAAAYASGFISASDAIVLAYFRGKVVRDINTNGAMLAVGLGAEDVEPYVAKHGPRVAIACHNSPSSITLSGDAPSIEALQTELTSANIFARVLKTDGKAYHSPHMAKAASTYEALVRRAKEGVITKDIPLLTSTTMVSSVTALPISRDAVLDASYFSTNLAQPVLFNQALQYVLTTPSFSHIDTLIEVGPHSALAGPIRQIKATLSRSQLTYLPTLVRNENSAANLLSLAGELFIRQYSPLDMKKVTSIEQIGYPDSEKTVEHKKGDLIVDLPPYQWGTKCYWAESRQSKEHRFAKHPRHDLLGSLMPGCSMVEPTWRNILRVRDVPWLRDHCLGGEAVFPAAGYFSMAMEAITQVLELGDNESHGIKVEGFVLRDVNIFNALVTPDDDTGMEVMTNLRPETYDESKSVANGKVAGRWFQFSISSVSEHPSTPTTTPSSTDAHSTSPKYASKTHISGRIKVIATSNANPQGPPTPYQPVALVSTTEPPIPLSKPLAQRASGGEWFSALRKVGFHYGPTFNDLSDIRFNGKDYICSANTTIKNVATAPSDPTVSTESRYVLHPACVDSGLQLMIAAIYAGKSKAMGAGAVPVQVEEVRIRKPTVTDKENTNGYSAGRVTSWSSDRGVRSFICGTEMVDAEGRVVLQIEGMKCVLYEAAIPQGAGGFLGGMGSQKSMEYGKMVWRLDVDELVAKRRALNMKSSETSDGIVRLNGDIKWYVGLMAFKTPGIRVLDVGGTDEESLGSLDGVVYTPLKTDSGGVSDELSTLGVGAADLILVNVETLQNYGPEVFATRLRDRGKLIILDTNRSSARNGIVAITSELTHTAEATLINDNGDEIGIIVSSQETTGSNAGNVRSLTSGTGRSHPNTKTEVWLVHRDNAHTALIQSIISEFSACYDEYNLVAILLSDVSNLPPTNLTHVIILDTSERLILSDITEPEFLAVQKLTTHASTLAWVTAGGLLHAKIPAAGLSSGLLRSLRSEQASLRAVALDFEPLSCFSETGRTQARDASLEQMAMIIVGKTVQQIQDPSSLEEEYVYDSEGGAYISRLMAFDNINERYRNGRKMRGGDEIKAVSQVWDVETSQRRITACSVSGGAVIFEHSPAPSAKPGPREVEVRVLQVCLGKDRVDGDSSSILPSCQEIGGVITAVGSEVAGLAAGDTVVGISFDKFGTYQTVSDDLLTKVDDIMGLRRDESRLAQLVSLPAAYATALHGLRGLADVQPGENVLILPGAGHIGSAAVDVARMVGAVPHVVVSTPEEKEAVSSRHHLAEKQVIELSDLLSSGIQSHLKVDVILSTGSSPEELSREAWRSIAPYGRFICSRQNKATQQNTLDTLPFQRGASYHAFNIVDMCGIRPALVQRLLHETFDSFRHKTLAGFGSAINLKSITEVEETDMTFKFSDDWTSPKTVISFEPCTTSVSSTTMTSTSATISLVRSTSTAPVAELNADSTYLLVGCLGGLGRSLTSWMMSRGARNFCFLSRSGADSPEAAQLVQDLMASSGANVQIVRGDVAKLEDVERAVRGISPDKPLRGVVQAAMVLRDGLFHSSSYEDWVASITPKVHGTANLQTVLSTLAHQLDFFLLTSSVSGILGTPGQANYAAGNAYLDAVARHRRANGQNACAAIVPMVLGVGVVAESDGLEEKLRSKGMYGIDEDELLRALEIAVVEQQQHTSNHETEQGAADKPDHLVIGLDPAHLVTAAQDQGTEATEAFWRRDKRFSMLIHHMKESIIVHASDKTADGSTGTSGSILSSITGASTVQEGIKIARESIEGKLIRMLMLDAGVFGEGGDREGGGSRSVASYGIDSMIGAELRNWLFREFGLDIPFQQLLGPTLTLGRLAERVCESCGIVIAEGA